MKPDHNEERSNAETDRRTTLPGRPARRSALGRARRIILDAEQIKCFAAEYDPQPFHLSDEGAANNDLFGTLAASGWHTMALHDAHARRQRSACGWTDRRQPGSGVAVADATGNDASSVQRDHTDIRPSRSKPDMAMVTMRSETRDEKGDVLLIFMARMPVSKRARA